MYRHQNRLENGIACDAQDVSPDEVQEYLAKGDVPAASELRALVGMVAES